MGKRLRLLVSALLFACVPAGIAATAASPPELSARDLVGTTVVDPKGALLGDIDGFVVDWLGGTVRDAVVRGLAREVTVPLAQLRFTPRGHAVAGLRAGVLAEAPAYRGAFWPEIASWALIGRTVRGPEGEALGEVTDIVFHPASGRVQYVLAEIGARTYRLPIGALVMQRSDGPLVLDVTRAMPPVTSRLPKLRPVAERYDSVVPGNIGMTVRREQNGVVVSAVKPGGPAAKAGVKVGDAVLRYNGQVIVDAEQFNRLVHDTRPGTMAKVELARDGIEKPLLVDIPVKQLDLTPRAQGRFPSPD